MTARVSLLSSARARSRAPVADCRSTMRSPGAAKAEPMPSSASAYASTPDSETTRTAAGSEGRVAAKSHDAIRKPNPHLSQVAHALLRAASALIPTPGPGSVETSLDTAPTSACATSSGPTSEMRAIPRRATRASQKPCVRRRAGGRR
jgi:hypothetical protein